MSEPKRYEVEGLEFEFRPNGSPMEGLMAGSGPEGTFSSSVNLVKAGSRALWAKEACELYGMDASQLKRALNEICTLRTEEVTVVARAGEKESLKPDEHSVSDSEIEELVARPGVLDRFVENAARVQGVVGERDTLKLLALNAMGAQLEPLPNGRPAGANVVLIAPPGRGKNFLADAVAAPLPEEFYLAFESASSKSLFYRVEQDPTLLRHTWIYPNEAEATDQLIEMLRPLLSGGRASHLTVNKDTDGRNAAQEFNAEGPVTVTIPTVRNKLDSQLQSRLLVSELPDFDGRVPAHSRAVSRQLLPDQAGEDHEPRIRVWQGALRQLSAVRRVVFPLDHEGFCFDSDAVSHGARLWGNVLGLMSCNAWLEQRNRELIDLPDGARAIVATPQDYEAAYEIFKVTCERSIVNLSDTHRRILDAVHALKEGDNSTYGYSLRKIAEKAGVHHSTVSDHKTYLTRSVKLLREVEGGGLDLVAGAEPSWWRAGDLPAGLPHPENVWQWWREQGADPSPDTARQARHHQSERQNADSYGDRGVGHSSSQPPVATSRRERDGLPDGVAVGGTRVADKVPAGENGSSTGGNGPCEAVSGASGGTGRNGAHEPAYVANNHSEDGQAGASDGSMAHALTEAQGDWREHPLDCDCGDCVFGPAPKGTV